jgi:hypothetical protein
VPELLDVLGHKVRQAGVDVAGGDRVDTCEIAPFVGQGSRQVDAAGFGDVVGCLIVEKKSQVSIYVQLSRYLLKGNGNQEDGESVISYLFLGEVGNVARHGCSDDEAAGLPLSEMQTDGSGTVVNTGQIGLDDLIPLLDRSIEDATVGSTASVGNEDIDLAEVLDDISH